MIKKYLIELADYNSWANDIVCNWLSQIDNTQWEKPIESSFSSIAKTCLHIASAEHAWYLRIERKPFEWIANSFNGEKEDLLKLWNEISTNLNQVAKSFDETNLTQILHFTRLNGEKKSQPFYQIFAHVFNHSTYHRGQLVTMLRQVGFTKVSTTDLLSFY